ncbi:MAG: FAD-binding oxidoreductase [Gemmatimonadota bacterium]|nr:FAD-binding oxidoreductase [Gemmatimonadota bacterium]
MSDTADAVIIGAGIMGCSTAFYLAQRGLKPIVLEKGAIGSGSTGRSSAIIRQHYSNTLTARMALDSLRVFENFDEQVGGDCGFVQSGWIGIVPGTDVDGLRENVALQRAVGIETELLSPEALRQLVPKMATDDIVEAAYEPKSGYADPHLTVSGFVDGAKRHGAVFKVGVEVTGIRFEGGRVAGVDTSQGGFDAPLVINCAGPWGARVAEMAGIAVPVNPCRIQIAVYRHAPQEKPDFPVVIDFVNGTYFRPETGNLTIAGSIDPSEGDNIVDPDDYPEHCDDDFALEIGEGVMHRYPPLETAQTAGGYSGLYAVTPDWHPVMDEVPSGSGFFLCTGFSGHGFKLAPTVGKMTADMVLNTPNDDFPTDLFRLARFKEGDLVRGRYAYSIAG